jgi:hypothetical protein
LPGEGLEIRDVTLSPEEVSALFDALKARAICGTLRHMQFHRCYLGNNGASAIAEHLPESLTSLDLSINSIGDDGAREIAEHLPQSLISLDLGGNSIGPDGAREIAEHLPQSLISLDLDGNSIGPDGARAIAEHLPESLTSLDLIVNSIGPDGARAILRRSEALPLLSYLHLYEHAAIGLPESGLASTDPRALREAFEAAQLAKAKHQYALAAKAVILGNGGTGKSHLAEWLKWYFPHLKQPDLPRPDFEPNQDATHAFKQHSIGVELPAGGVTHDVDVNLYDFGGQEEIHGAHRFFMSDSRNVFIILVSRAHRDGQSSRDDERGRSLEFYLRMAHHHGPEQPVIVVVGWSDSKKKPNGDPWPDKAHLRTIHPNTTVVDGYSSTDGRGVDTIATHLHTALASLMTDNQILQPAGDFFLAARDGIIAHNDEKKKANGSDLGYVWAEIRGRDPRNPPWYATLFRDKKFKGKDTLPATAITMLRDIGKVHWVGDRVFDFTQKHGHDRPDTSLPGSTAEHAARQLKDVFFSPEDIKTGVYNVLRKPNKRKGVPTEDQGEDGVLTEEQLRTLLRNGGLSSEPDQDQIILLMEACELIYRLETVKGTAAAWLVPDRLPFAPAKELESHLREWGEWRCGACRLGFVPSALIWRYLGRRFSNRRLRYAGVKQKLYRDVGVLDIGKTSVLLIAGESEIEIFVKASDEPSRQRIEDEIRSGLERAIGTGGTTEYVPKSAPSPQEMKRAVAAWLDAQLAAHVALTTSEQRPQGLISGKYLLLRKCGEGGFGIVYEALEWGKEDPVALKMTPFVSKDDATYERARLEHMVTAYLRQGETHLPHALDIDDSLHVPMTAVPGPHQFVRAIIVIREFIDGTPLSVWSEQQGRSWRDIASTFLGACAGVQELHQRSVHHLDLKPDNILVDRNGRAWIIDLGSAQDSRRLGRVTQTQQGQPLTPEYAAPELFGLEDLLNIKPSVAIGPHTDVFALGRVLELLFRKAPPTAHAALAAVIRDATAPMLYEWTETWKTSLADASEADQAEFWARLHFACPEYWKIRDMDKLNLRAIRTVDELIKRLNQALRA